MRPVKFSNNDIAALSAIIEEKDHVDVEPLRELSGIWLRSPDTWTELRLLILSDVQVTVSRVCFTHQRSGCMTAVFGWLKEFCRKNGIHRIVVQSVQTEEMAGWCIKNGFQSNESTFVRKESVVGGDYFFRNALRARDLTF